MLRPAKHYEDEIKEFNINNYHNDRYMYYFSYREEEYTAPDDNWYAVHQVSIDECTGEILGLIIYCIERNIYAISNISVMSFSDKPNITFSIDVLQVVDDIFYKFNYTKLIFNVRIGSGLDKMYDKFISKFGGRVVGTFLKEDRLWNGDIVDVKVYEILKEEYKRNEKTNIISKD